jgi:hypothetical protein
MMMQKLLIAGLIGAGAYWYFFLRKPAATVQSSGGTPVQTTGAPQPQGVQAYPRAIADVYDLQAYPMGSFVGR